MSTSDPQEILEIGQLFAGRYAIEGTLGKGGFSRVYAARQLNLGREVALKIFAPRDLQNKEARQRLAKRFMKEAQLLARLNDPHTITLHDYGVTADGELFQVFELISGVTFKQLVRQQGSLPVDRLVPIITQILWSLSEAHRIGMIHRDIKPSNIMIYDHLDRHDCVKVLDFGVAKLVKDYDTAQSDMTADGMILGTPRYMSPEQIIGEPLTPSCDIYSLGIVVYEAIFSQLPYDKDLNLLRRRQQQITHKIELPDWFEDETMRRFLNRSLAGDPAQRYADATEALHALTKPPPPEDNTLPFIKTPDIVALIDENPYDTSETPNTLTAHSRVAGSSRSTKVALPLMILIIISLIGVIVILLQQPDSQDPVTQSVTEIPANTVATSPKLDRDKSPTPALPEQAATTPAKKEPAPKPVADVKPKPRTEPTTPKPRAEPAKPAPEPTPSKSVDLFPTKKKTTDPTPSTKKKDDVNLFPTKKKKTPSGFVITPLDEK